jgi:hypothetical protein
MANRVTAEEVQAIIDVVSGLDVSAFITAANLLVTEKLGSSSLSVELLKEIERWLAAHFVAVRDPRIRERTVGDATDKFILGGGFKSGLDATPYGQQVMVLDITGIFASTMGKRSAEVVAISEDYS